MLSLVAVVCLVEVVACQVARVAEATYHRRRSMVVVAIDHRHVHRQAVAVAVACLTVPEPLVPRQR